MSTPFLYCLFCADLSNTVVKDKPEEPGLSQTKVPTVATITALPTQATPDATLQAETVVSTAPEQPPPRLAHAWRRIVQFVTNKIGDEKADILTKGGKYPHLHKSCQAVQESPERREFG